MGVKKMNQQLYSLMVLLAGLGNVLLQDCNMSDHRFYKRMDFHDSNEHWINPSRGFYHTSLAFSNSQDFEPLTESQLDCWRNRDGISLLLREYVLDDYVNGMALTQTFLSHIDSDLALLRHAGWNVILRFMYNKDTDLIYKFNEPQVSYIVSHIHQLQGILSKHEPIILAIQAGFLGEYGVWYTPGQQSGTNEPIAENQKKILNALLHTVPSSIQIQVPKPKYKQIYTRRNQTSYFDVLTHADQSRIGHYHECLVQEGQTNHFVDAFPDLQNNPELLHNVALDTKFTLMGGRTCSPGIQGIIVNYCGQAETLFKTVHMSYLDGYNNDVMLQNFKQYGCYEAFYNKLGYQFLLQFVILPKQAEIGSDICIQVSFSNYGYAATYRDFDVDLVFVSQQNITYKTTIVNQTRILEPINKPLVGDKHTIHLDRSMPTGVYKVYLRIVDPMLYNDTNYYVLIASNDNNNNSLVKPSLGLNLLGEIELQPVGTLNSHQSVGTEVKRLTRISLPPANHHERKYVDGTTTGCVQLPAKPTKPTTNFTAYMTCNKVNFVKALLEDNNFDDIHSSQCPDGSRHASEAILFRFCNATPTFTWKPVPGKVIDMCNKIKMYTPIAQFDSASGKFRPSNISGVFLGCRDSLFGVPGIKIGYETCMDRLDVRFLVSGNSLDNMHIVSWS